MRDKCPPGLGPPGAAGRWPDGAYLRQDVLLVVCLVLQGLGLRGCHRLRGRRLAGSGRGHTGHAAGGHTQSQPENQQQRLGHEGETEGARPGNVWGWVRRRLGQRVSWLESESGAQRAVPHRVQPSSRGPGAPETLVISVRMGASSPGRREGGGDPASSDSNGGAPGSSGQPEVAQRGLPGTWGARTGRLLGADRAKSSQREGGASIVQASEVQPVTAEGEEEREGGKEGGGPRSPGALTRPGAPAFAPGVGWRGRGPFPSTDRK